MIDLQELIRTPIGADAALRALTLKAIYTAVVSGLTVTASISGTGPSAEEKNQMFRDLASKGLTVTNSGSTFTVSWA
jgi:hypothetical protein